MEIKLTGRHFKITPAIRSYVRRKLGKAEKYFDHIVWAEMVVFIEKRAHKAEIVLHAARQTFRALASAGDLYSAIDLASDKIDSQLKKHKERLKDHHRMPAIDAAGGSAAPGDIRFYVTKKKVSPITPEEAAEEMEDLGQEFMVFQDKKSLQINVIFRRGDESYGILQPVKKR